MFIDTHCHLDFPEFDPDRDTVIQRAKDEGVGLLINIGSSLKGSLDSVRLAQGYDCVYASVGIHPHEADSFNEEAKGSLKELVKEKKVVAIGEIGLDYFRNYSEPGNQLRMFSSLLKLALEFGLPAVIHCRQAEDDLLRILKEYKPPSAVVHCFSGNEDFLNYCLEAGFYISFTCNITYKKAGRLRDLAKVTPIERLFLETDAPFLPPEGKRGKRCEPFDIKRLACEIAGLKSISVDEVGRITTENARKFFNLK